ncbi:MAG: hypothetical protein ABL958_12065, partial [Bdellovibrionia bacterium]
MLANVAFAQTPGETAALCNQRYPQPSIPTIQNLTEEETRYLTLGIGQGFRTSAERARVTRLLNGLRPKLEANKSALQRQFDNLRPQVLATAAVQQLKLRDDPVPRIEYADRTPASFQCAGLRPDPRKQTLTEKDVKDLQAVFAACSSALKAEAQETSLAQETWTNAARANAAITYLEGLTAYFTWCGRPELLSSDRDCRTRNGNDNTSGREAKLRIAKDLLDKARAKSSEHTAKFYCESDRLSELNRKLSEIDRHLEFRTMWLKDPAKMFPAKSVDFTYRENTTPVLSDRECQAKYLYPVIPPPPAYSSDEIRLLSIEGTRGGDEKGNPIWIAPLDEKYRTGDERDGLRQLLRGLDPKLTRAERALTRLYEEQLPIARRNVVGTELTIEEDGRFLKLSDPAP